VTQALLLLLAAVNPFAAGAGLVSALAARRSSPEDAAVVAAGRSASRDERDADADPARQDGRVTLAVGLAVAAATAVLLAGLSDPILDLLDVSLPTFQVGAAIVVGLSGFLWLIRGAAQSASTDEQLPAAGPWRGLIVPLLVPVLVTPGLVVASITAGADHGVVSTTLAAVLTLAVAGLGALAPRSVSGSTVVWAVGARFVGALAIVLALALAVDGVKSV